MADCNTLSSEVSSGACNKNTMGVSNEHPSESWQTGSKRCRQSDSSEDDSDYNRPNKFFRDAILAVSDSPAPKTDPGSETELTMQDYETDYACSWSSISDGTDTNGVGHIEYEIRSEKEDTIDDSSSSSDAHLNNFKGVTLPLPLPYVCGGDGAASSGASCGSSDVFDPEIPRRDYWTCLECKNINNRPAFRYCEKCYKVKRDMHQRRTKPRKKRKRNDAKISSSLSSRPKTPINILNVVSLSSNWLEQVGKAKDDSLNLSVPNFGGVKLDTYSQETKDSGVGSSQRTITLSPPSLYKDSDSNLSQDSAAEPHGFTGVKLSSTRDTSYHRNLLSTELKQSIDEVIKNIGKADCMQSSTSQDVDEVDCMQPSSSQDIDEVDCMQCSTSKDVDEVDCIQASATQDVDEVDCMQPSATQDVDEVDCMQPSATQDVDEVDCMQPSATQDVDEVDCMQPSATQDVDEVDCMQPSATQDADEVDCMLPSASQDADEVDCMQPSTSQDADDVDLTKSVSSSHSSQAVDEVDCIQPTSSKVVDELDCIQPPHSTDYDEVDCIQLASSQDDDVDSIQLVSSQDVDEIDSIQFESSQDVDEIDCKQTASAQNTVECVQTVSSQDIVDCVQPTSSKNADKVDCQEPASSQDVDEVDGIQPTSSHVVGRVGTAQLTFEQDADVADSTRCTSACDCDEVDLVQPVSTEDKISSVQHSSLFSSSSKDVKLEVNQHRDEVDLLQPIPKKNAEENILLNPIHSSNVNKSEVDSISVLPAGTHSVAVQTENDFISSGNNQKEESNDSSNKCMTCYSRPIDGVFVHTKLAHMCCCYICARKIWKMTKRCPLCNCRSLNVLRVFTL